MVLEVWLEPEITGPLGTPEFLICVCSTGISGRVRLTCAAGREWYQSLGLAAIALVRLIYTVGGPIEGRVPRCRLPAQVTGPRERTAASAKLLMQAAREMHDVGKG